jgi:hypothetical protein
VLDYSIYHIKQPGVGELEKNIDHIKPQSI